MSNENENENALAPNPANAALAAFGGFDNLVEQMEASEASTREETSKMRDGSVLYARFRKGGEQGDISPWEYGQDGVEIDPESVWVVDPTTLEHGFMGWESGSKGNPTKGEEPDQVFAPWNEAWPAKPEDKPWVKNIAFRFRALCVESPSQDDVGVVVEFTVHQKMQEGFKDVELALRARVKEAARAKASGDMERFGELMTNIYPKVHFKAKTKIKTKFGYHNKPILDHFGWTSAVQNLDAPEAPSEPEGTLDEEVAKAKDKKGPAKPAARRRRGRED